MPLYTITTQAGVLDSSAKSDLAEKLSAFHADLRVRFNRGLTCSVWARARF